MKLWIAVFGGVLLAALPYLGNGAPEDTGVYVSEIDTKFEKRVLPANARMVCTTNYNEFEWHRINKFERILQDFERGDNSLNATFSLGTAAVLIAMVAEVEFENAAYCKYLPLAYQDATELNNPKAEKWLPFRNAYEYYAVPVNDTGRATIKKGFRYLSNLLNNRFVIMEPSNLMMLIVEQTTEGVTYVGAIQDYIG